MLDLAELAQGLSAHSLGRGIRMPQFGMGRLQLLQFPQQPVIFKVLQLGIIQNIVTMVRFQKDLRQFLYPVFRFHRTLRFVKMYRAHRPR